MFRLLTLILLFGIAAAYAADNYPINTFGGTRTVLRATDEDGVHTPHVYSSAAPSSGTAAGVSNAQSTTNGSSLVVKATAGNLYQLTTTIGATSGYLLLFDAATLPANGAVTPLGCWPVASNGANGVVSLAFDPPKPFATGITAGFSTTGCFTLTASATAAFFAGYK